MHLQETQHKQINKKYGKHKSIQGKTEKRYPCCLQFSETFLILSEHFGGDTEEKKNRRHFSLEPSTGSPSKKKLQLGPQICYRQGNIFCVCLRFCRSEAGLLKHQTQTKQTEKINFYPPLYSGSLCLFAPVSLRSDLGNSQITFCHAKPVHCRIR